ncbi:hypothetical protein ABPG74_005110 [Tetrahymena malaccensis]
MSLLDCENNSENYNFLNFYPQLKQFTNQLSSYIYDNGQYETIQRFQDMKIKQVINNNNPALFQLKELIKETPLITFIQLASITQKDVKQIFLSKEQQEKIKEIYQLSEQYQEEQEINQKKMEFIKQLKDQQSNLEEYIKELKESNNKYQNDVQQIQQQNEKFSKDIEQLQKYKEEFEKKNKYQPQKDESEYGYDMIIQMKSVFDLQNIPQISKDDTITNEIIYSNQVKNNLQENQQSSHLKQQGLKVQLFNNYTNMQMKNVIIIGMQGQRNKGKTFILNSLINEQFPSDYHVSTPGICIKYHSLNNKNIVYIDSEGLGCPITIDYENNKHYQTFMDNKLNKGCDDIQSQENLSLDITNRHQDLKATEQIQQDFIIENSNILIIVVSYLTLDDQKLIHSISQQFVIDKNNPKQKKLLVVHNLKEYHRPEYVKKYMDDLKMVFPLTQQPVNTYNKQYDDENNIVYVDNIKPHINHLVMAYSNSEAGRIYNKFSLYFLKQMIELYQGSINFNVPMKLVDYLNKHLQSYVTLRKESDDVKQNPQIKDFLEYNTQKQAVMLKQGYIIDRVKELQVNVFGSLQKDCSYSIVNNDEKKERYLLLEIPGSAVFKKKFDKCQGQFIIIIQQNSDLESKLGEIQASTRKLDEKYYTIQICKEKELWNIHNDRQENLSNGIYKFVFTQDIQDDFE